MKNKYIAIIDDDEVILNLVGKILRNRSIHLELFSTPRIFLESLDFNKPDLVITDLMMPEINGMQMHEKAKVKAPDVPFMMLTTEAKIETALEALRSGFIDYVFKPIDPDEFGQRVTRALDYTVRTTMNTALYNDKRALYSADNFIAAHKSTRLVKEAILKGIRDIVLPHWFIGEQGVGKMTAALTMHYDADISAEAPLLEVDCASVRAKEQYETFFGSTHKLSQSGKETFLLGLLHKAHGGTLIVRSPEMLDAATLDALVQFLQHPILKTGERERQVSVRLVFISRSSSVQKTLAKVASEQFREFWNDSALYIPTLKERTEDIVPLAEHYFQYFGKKFQQKILLTDGAKKKLESLEWSKNVIELVTAIQYFTLLAPGGELTAHDILTAHVGKSLGEDKGKFFSIPQGLTMRSMQGEYVKQTLEHFEYNLENTAKSLGITRKTLWEVRKKYDL